MAIMLTSLTSNEGGEELHIRSLYGPFGAYSDRNGCRRQIVLKRKRLEAEGPLREKLSPTAHSRRREGLQMVLKKYSCLPGRSLDETHRVASIVRKTRQKQSSIIPLLGRCGKNPVIGATRDFGYITTSFLEMGLK